MNPFSGVSWLWRAWRGRSITFAALFALGILGFSVLSSFRHLLSHWGAPWYIWFLAPMVLVAMLSRKEEQWLPDVERRRKWSRWLVLGSLIVAFLISWLSPNKPVTPSTPEPIGRSRVGGR